MARVPDLKPEEMDAEQARIHDEIARPRGGVVAGPFAIWLRNPAVADRANQFGNALRLHGKLDKRLFELMVLVVARHWGAQYEWHAHEKQALANGISSEIVEAIRAHRAPPFAADDERLIYEIVREMNDTRHLSQASYERALAFFGLDLLIELISSIGFYTMVAMVLNGFDAPVPGGQRPLP